MDDGSKRETAGDGAGLRKYCGVKRVDKRKMEKLRMEFRVKDSFKKNKLVRSMLKLAGHVERM